MQYCYFVHLETDSEIFLEILRDILMHRILFISALIDEISLKIVKN